MIKKPYFTFLPAIVLAIMLVLPGCGQDISEINIDSTITEAPMIYDSATLWVVTDDDLRSDSPWDEQLKYIIRQFEETHDVGIELEVLPSDLDQREVALERINAEIREGKGPDVYLLPTFSGQGFLFNDVNQAMRDGMFANISVYYDLDTELKTEGLNTTVMDAGTLGVGRFVLPLRYDFPVAYVNTEALHESGLDTDMFDGGAVGMMDALTELNDAKMAKLAEIDMHAFSMNFFPDLLDYDNQSLLITQDMMVDLLDSYIPYNKLANAATDVEYVDPYFRSYLKVRHWLQTGDAIDVASVSAALYNVAIAKAEGITLEMYPLTCTNGLLVADVSYYGAVGADCKNPEAAYEFLREFLTEESQWEQNVTSVRPWDEQPWYGYCVRNTGSVETLYTHRLNTFYDTSPAALPSDQPLVNRLLDVELTEADVPVLQAEIAVARFPISDYRFQFVHSLINVRQQNPSKGPVDYESLAADFLQTLEDCLPEN